MTCVIFRLFSWAMGRTGKKKRSPCSLKSEYQPCGYIPAEVCDAGKSAMTSRTQTASHLFVGRWPQLLVLSDAF